MDEQDKGKRPLLRGPDLLGSLPASVRHYFSEARLARDTSWIDRAIKDPEMREKLRYLVSVMPPAQVAKLRGEVEAFARKARRFRK